MSRSLIFVKSCISLTVVAFEIVERVLCFLLRINIGNVGDWKLYTAGLFEEEAFSLEFYAGECLLCRSEFGEGHKFDVRRRVNKREKRLNNFCIYAEWNWRDGEEKKDEILSIQSLDDHYNVRDWCR